MRTTTRARRLALAAVVAVCGLLAGTAGAGQTAPGDPLDPRTYAPQSRLFLTVHATGVQKYTCQANGTWLFTDPEAVLYKAAHNLKPIGTHFLNFTTGRPVWRFKDGSSVEAARTASAPGGTGNIAWLLLQAVAHERRPRRRPPRRDDLGAAAEHLRRSRSGRRVHARRHRRRPLRHRLPLLDGEGGGQRRRLTPTGPGRPRAASGAGQGLPGSTYDRSDGDARRGGPGSWTVRYLAHNGIARQAHIALPGDLGPANNPPVPLVISPHGRGITGRANLNFWGDLPARGRFAVISPRATGGCCRSTRGAGRGRSTISRTCSTSRRRRFHGSGSSLTASMQWVAAWRPGDAPARCSLQHPPRRGSRSRFADGSRAAVSRLCAPRQRPFASGVGSA